MVQRTDSPADVLPSAGVLPPADVPPKTADGLSHSASEVSGPVSRWRRVLSAMGVGARYGVGGAVGLWLADVVRVAIAHGGASWRAWLTGVGAALYVTLTTAFVAGALLGPIALPIVTEMATDARAYGSIVRAGGAAARRKMGAQIVALVALTGLWLVIAYDTAFVVEFDFARPESIAAVTTLAHLATFVALALVSPWVARIASIPIEAAARLKGRKGFAPVAWTLSVIVGASVLGLAIRVLVANRSELAAMPWPDALVLIGLILGWVATARLARARPMAGLRPARVALALVACGLVLGGFAAVRLRPESTSARILAFERMLSGRIGYAAWLVAFDFDRDGQLSMLGGGDCAPFDPKRYTGAVEIPGNGIDEDCDGFDLPKNAIHPRGRMAVGQGFLPNRPTIVLITIDAVGGPRLTSLGSPVPLMPNVDKLADDSMLFTHCFSQGPSTRLSFPATFTSRWDSELTQVFSARFPYSLAPSEHQLQDMMNEAGYDTAAVLPASYFAPERWQSMTRGFQHVDTSAIPTGKHNAPQVADAALRVLASPRDRPLYLWVHFYDAHGPYQPLPNAPKGHHDDLELYDAELGYIDREIGRLVAAIEARPEPTYLILSADHATVFHPDPSTRRAHYGYDLYTATLHVPLIVHGPHIKPGRADGVVSTMDIAPTIADLVKAPEQPKFEGQSLLPEILAGKSDPDRTLFHEFYLGERLFRGQDPLEIVSARNSHWNLVLSRLKGTYELYDWQADYYEQHNLFEDEGRRPDVMQLRSLLSAFVAQYHPRPADEAMLPPPKSDEP